MKKKEIIEVLRCMKDRSLKKAEGLVCRHEFFDREAEALDAAITEMEEKYD
jgi:NurA-like 5'-3' nuclease